MEIYPAVDLYEGKVVRLERGDYRKCKIYSQDPGEIARRWAEGGARWLHVVDLEGARSGSLQNRRALEKILSENRLSVQFGGGIRHTGDIEEVLSLGVRRVILGTKVLDPSFLKEVTGAYGTQIALSLDLRGEEIQVEGWLKGSGKSIFELFGELVNCRIGCMIVTDIERDGALEGVNLEKIKQLLEKASFPLIYSGGISSLDDIRSVVSLRNQVGYSMLNGVIIGKALYEGKVDLREALKLAQGGRIHGSNPTLP